MIQVNVDVHMIHNRITFICPMGTPFVYHRLNCNKSTGKYLRCKQVREISAGNALFKNSETGHSRSKPPPPAFPHHQKNGRSHPGPAGTAPSWAWDTLAKMAAGDNAKDRFADMGDGLFPAPAESFS